MFGLTNRQVSIILSRKTAGMAYRIMQFVYRRNAKGATCDECTHSLRLPYQATGRFHELAAVKCLIKTTRKRKTSTGGYAFVYIVPKRALFAKYLFARRLRRANPKQRLTTIQQMILATGQNFLKSWKKAKTIDIRQQCIIRLVRKFQEISAV